MSRLSDLESRVASLEHIQNCDAAIQALNEIQELYKDMKSLLESQLGVSLSVTEIERRLREERLRREYAARGMTI